MSSGSAQLHLKRKARISTLLGAAAFLGVATVAAKGLETVRTIPAATVITEDKLASSPFPLPAPRHRLVKAEPEMVQSKPSAIQLVMAREELEEKPAPVDPVAFARTARLLKDAIKTHQSAHAAQAALAEAALQPALAEQDNTAPTDAQANCVDVLRGFAEGQRIHFSIGSADIPYEGLSTLEYVAQEAARCPDAIIHVTGHSDSTGSDQFNLALSWKRADNAIAKIESLGFDGIAFKPVGFGARTPLSQGDTADDELNRRVEFEVYQRVQEVN